MLLGFQENGFHNFLNGKMCMWITEITHTFSSINEDLQFFSTVKTKVALQKRDKARDKIS